MSSRHQLASGPVLVERHVQQQGQLGQLRQQAVYWTQLTEIIQPHLPDREKWQVACYQDGVLTLCSDSQALVCKLRYLQQQYLPRLRQLDGLQQLRQLRLIVADQTPPRLCQQPIVRATPLSHQTRTTLLNAAHQVRTPQLSLCLQQMATRR